MKCLSRGPCRESEWKGITYVVFNGKLVGEIGGGTISVGVIREIWIGNVDEKAEKDKEIISIVEDWIRSGDKEEIVFEV